MPMLYSNLRQIFVKNFSTADLLAKSPQQTFIPKCEALMNVYQMRNKLIRASKPFRN